MEWLQCLLCTCVEVHVHVHIHVHVHVLCITLPVAKVVECVAPELGRSYIGYDYDQACMIEHVQNYADNRSVNCGQTVTS